MPLYEYVCDACEHKFEVLHAMGVRDVAQDRRQGTQDVPRVQTSEGSPRLHLGPGHSPSLLTHAPATQSRKRILK